MWAALDAVPWTDREIQSPAAMTESVTHFGRSAEPAARLPQRTESDVRTWSRKESLERGEVCDNEYCNRILAD